MKLSIIVCVYNTDKKYLTQCLESIRASTLKDYEIIMIDDGSDTDYSEIVEKYKPRYVKTENRGHMAARLYAITLANGEYTAFVDSDDTVTFNYHAPMVRLAQSEDCDVVLNDWAFSNESYKGYCTEDDTVSEDVKLEGEEILPFFLASRGRMHSHFVLWNKVYRTVTLKKAKKDLEKTDAITKRLAYSEDALINFFVFKNAKKVQNIHTGYYFYRIHSEQSVACDSEEKLKSQIDAMTFTLDTMRECVGTHKNSEKILEDIKAWSELMARAHYSYAKNAKYETLYPYIKEKYGVEELKTATVKDSSAYNAQGILGSNFDNVESVLRYAYSKGIKEICYDRKDKYVSSAVDYLNKYENAGFVYSKDSHVSVPKQEISLLKRIIHSGPVYTLGLILFKKGSKSRAYLKRKL